MSKQDNSLVINYSNMDSLTGGDLLSFNEGWHQYKNLEGEVVPSVTQILDVAGVYKNKRFFTEEGRDRGSKVHKIAEAVFTDQEIEIPKAFQGYFEALMDFKSASPIQIKFTEKKLYHPLDGFCGTVDLIGELKASGEKALIDIKSGQPDQSTGLQLGGYSILLDRERAEFVKRYALHINKNGKYRLEPYLEDEWVRHFYSAWDLYQWKKKNGVI